MTIDKEKLSPEERKKFEDGWTNNAFNGYVSDMISLHRSLADIRDPAYDLFLFLKKNLKIYTLYLDDSKR